MPAPRGRQNRQAADAISTTTSAAGAASAQGQPPDAIFEVRPDHAVESRSPHNQNSGDRKAQKGSKRARARADVQAEHEPSQGAGYLTVNPLFAGTGSASVAVARAWGRGERRGTAEGS